MAKPIGLARTIVGRERELAAAVQFLDLMSAEACALVIDGEAGIGKTTIWREAVRLARERAFWVLEGRPAQSEARLSYAGLADLIGIVFEESGRRFRRFSNGALRRRFCAGTPMRRPTRERRQLGWSAS